MRRLVCATILAVAACGAARADKLIWIPTAEISKIQAEYMNEAGRGQNVWTAQLGLGRGFELLGRRYRNVRGQSDSTEIGGELQVLPEGFATPGLAIGVWDVSGETPRGRRVFGVLTKTVPVINWLPAGVKNIKLHAGFGTGSLSAAFIGAQASIPLGLTLAAEFDGSRSNFAVWWSPVPIVRLKAESWGGDVFLGAQLRSPL